MLLRHSSVLAFPPPPLRSHRRSVRFGFINARICSRCSDLPALSFSPFRNWRRRAAAAADGGTPHAEQATRRHPVTGGRRGGFAVCDAAPVRRLRAAPCSRCRFCWRLGLASKRPCVVHDEHSDAGDRASHGPGRAPRSRLWCAGGALHSSAGQKSSSEQTQSLCMAGCCCCCCGPPIALSFLAIVC